IRKSKARSRKNCTFLKFAEQHEFTDNTKTMSIPNEVLENLRKEYTLEKLSVKDVAKDPLKQFDKWLQAAISAGIPEPNAMTLATTSIDRKPSARVVLLKGCDERGFIFYSNY